MTRDQVAAGFSSDWARHVGTTGPLAHHLRQARLLPWIRFHALPMSKRYAETTEEKQIILTRADELATEILGEKADCWLVECRDDRFGNATGTGVKGHAALDIAEPEEDYIWTAYVTPVRWKAGSARRLLWQVAQDRTGPTLWINRTSGAIFAPYDGGFDLFPTSQQHVEALRRKYPDWLSNEPGGL